MIFGFMAVIVIALGLLYLSLYYNKQDYNTSTENYLAGSESEGND